MLTAQERLKKLGVAIPEIYLPSEGVDYRRFAVIACDQYTSQEDYWQRVERTVGNAPSSLNMMLPEIYISDDNSKETAKIHAAMDRYLADGTLKSIGRCFVYVKRRLKTGVRHGLVLALDLEKYDYHCGAHSMIRATEKTVEKRLPARIKIRENAALEMPHILVLVSDAHNRLVSCLEKMTLPLLYDFELMEHGGRITGRRVDREEDLVSVADALEQIMADGGDNFLFAVGDGNHSLASAKAFWDVLKETLTPQERETHPARYALVEVENIYDPAMVFEPIHRVLFGITKNELENEMDLSGSAQEIEPRLDRFLPSHPNVRVDYIHGRDDALSIAAKHGGAAIVFDSFDKQSLFDSVRKNGSLVRKSFSMGTASTKRFYLECRKIK